MIRSTVVLIALAALGLALSGCGTTREQKAATGAVAGALIAGPAGAAVGGAAGAAMARTDKPDWAGRFAPPETAADGRFRWGPQPDVGADSFAPTLIFATISA